MNLSENNSRSKEVLGAYLRQGAHELGAALFGPGTAAQHAEYGMAFTRPPGLVTDGLRAEAEPQQSRGDAEPPGLVAKGETPTPREPASPEIEPPEPDLERD